MQADGVIDRYAVGGAVAVTFYLEPMATLDIDIFVASRPKPGSIVITLEPIYSYLTALGCATEREYILIAGWPVQFLPSNGPLVEEALAVASEMDIVCVSARVFSAEHLAAIALQTGRAKDKARLLMFMESETLNKERFQEIAARHGLLDAWQRFMVQFVEEQH